MDQNNFLYYFLQVRLSIVLERFLLPALSAQERELFGHILMSILMFTKFQAQRYKLLAALMA